MNKVLVVAAHPDDEILGCGGTILKHLSKNDDVRIILMTNGEDSRHLVTSDDIQQRKNSTKQSMRDLGVSSWHQYSFLDNQMDTHPLLEIVKIVENEVAKHQPSIIYTHTSSDLNIDHYITHKATITACRPFNGQTIKKILCFEIPSSTEWNTRSFGEMFYPNYFEDITLYLEKKMNILLNYRNELREYPHPRSLEAIINLHKYRGSSVGIEAAEAFSLERCIKY